MMQWARKPYRQTVLAFVSLWLWPLLGCADTHNDGFPSYRPEHSISETIRSWGSPQMGGLLMLWEEGFRQIHSEARFSDNLMGTETAQAALYTEVADLALMDRDILMIEKHVMLRKKHHLPFAVKVAAGSHNETGRAPALAIFVHKDNPIKQLTIEQLDGIFGEQRTGAWDDKFRWRQERARSADKNIRNWDELGLSGEWTGKEIQVYGYPVTSYSPRPGPMMFFRQTIFHGADMWNANILEFEESDHMIAALGDDRYGIAYAPLAYRTSSVKPIAVGTAETRRYFSLTRNNVVNRKYPLARSAYIYIDWEPGKYLNPKVAEFLRYILSRQGQEDVAREGGFLPLTPAETHTELKKLAQPLHDAAGHNRE